MSNEEKILEMLAAMRSDIADVKATQAQQGEQLKELKATQSAMQATQAEHSELLKTLDARSLKSAVLLETEVARDIHLIYEGHSEINRKLNTLATKEQVKELADEVDVIRDVVSRHSGDIGRLKKAQ